MMINLFKKHTLISVYILVFFGITYGVFVISGPTYFGELAIYFVSLIFFYVIFCSQQVQVFLANRLTILKQKKIALNIYLLLIPTGLFILYHFFYIGGSPALQGLTLTYIEEVAILRYEITATSPSWMLYASAIILKGVLPFAVLYLFYTKRFLLYWIVLIIAVFYAFSLMQKSYVVGLLLPALIFCVTNKRFLFAAKYLMLMGLVVFSLAFIANPAGGSNGMIVNPDRTTTLVPELIPLENGESDNAIDEPEKRSKFARVAVGLYNRLLIVPGKVVSEWFDVIPSKKPFLHGDGYRLLALMRGRTYINYSTVLYPILKPKYAAQGLTGSVNVASFMYEYSNFGKPGLILSGFILAFLFILVEIFFADNFKLKLALNLFPILSLSSGAITTLLFSNGWGFLILFYYLFFKIKTNSNP